jgi:5-enolpyruvylshikimate-3-phosphate synthase
MADPKLEEVDQHLVQVIEALQSAVQWGMAHRDDSEALKKTVLDCKDLIDEVMDATILNW